MRCAGDQRTRLTGYRRDARERTAGEWSGVFGGWVSARIRRCRRVGKRRPGKGQRRGPMTIRPSSPSRPAPRFRWRTRLRPRETTRRPTSSSPWTPRRSGRSRWTTPPRTGRRPRPRTTAPPPARSPSRRARPRRPCPSRSWTIRSPEGRTAASGRWRSAMRTKGGAGRREYRS